MNWYRGLIPMNCETIALTPLGGHCLLCAKLFEMLGWRQQPVVARHVTVVLAPQCGGDKCSTEPPQSTPVRSLRAPTTSGFERCVHMRS